MQMKNSCHFEQIVLDKSSDIIMLLNKLLN